MNTGQLENVLNKFWDENILPTLIEYIKIPNKSPAFDPDWEKAGHMDTVLNLAVDWIKKHRPQGSILHVKKQKGRTPLLLLEIPGSLEGNCLMYGHLDKQPEMEGWREDLGPWKPVLEQGKLYGRGGADDGYALFASLGAIKALHEQGISLPRIVILIEFCEESGSVDLPFYIESCAPIIGSPDLVICLDSGAGNYKQFWTTVSLRGLIGFTVKVDVLKEGIHSGASGLVPSSFRILRQLISRVEDENTGEIIIEELHVKIPSSRIKEIQNMVTALSGETDVLPWSENMEPSTRDAVEGTLRKTWSPALSTVGVDGLPTVKDGGNVLRPYTALKFSLRLPPGLNAEKAQAMLEEILTKNPPYSASVSVEFDKPASGWNAPMLAVWLDTAIQEASMLFYGKEALAMGEGGTIPFMAMLGEKFPQAQFLITGVLGPGSNAHGPNEFLHIAYAKKLSACIAFILGHFQKQD